jgi:hypothetical protein
MDPVLDVLLVEDFSNLFNKGRNYNWGFNGVLLNHLVSHNVELSEEVSELEINGIKVDKGDSLVSSFSFLSQNEVLLFFEFTEGSFEFRNLEGFSDLIKANCWGSVTMDITGLATTTVTGLATTTITGLATAGFAGLARLARLALAGLAARSVIARSAARSITAGLATVALDN